MAAVTNIRVMTPSRTLLVRTLALPVGVLAVSALTLTACGGSSNSSSSPSAAPASSSVAPAPSSSSAAPAPHPDAECSEEALNAAAKHATGGSFGGVESFACDGGWAAVTGQMADNSTALLFMDEDGVWMPKETQETCQAGGLPAKVAAIACS